MKTQVAKGQSIFDIAVQHCGAAVAALDIAQLNNMSLTDPLAAGSEIELPAAVDTKTVQRIAFERIQPASEIADSEIEELLQVRHGIGYSRIGIDFTIAKN